MQGRQFILEENEEKQIKELTAFFRSQFKQWEKISKCRENFLKNTGESETFAAVRPEVMASWHRSKNYGVVPNQPLTRKVLDSAQFNKVLKENEQLMQVAVPLLSKQVHFLNKTKPFRVGLTDRNGILLFLYNSHIDQLKCSGLNLSEESVGTSAHAICLQLDKPMYLIGPEHYNEVMQRSSKVITAIPIHDARKNIVASFTFSYHRDLAQSKDEETLFVWWIAWQISMAQRIENAMEMASQKHMYSFDISLLSTAMSMLEDGMVGVNCSGRVIYVSSGGEKILGIGQNKILGKPYSDIIGNSPMIDNVLQGKITEATFAADIITGKKFKHCLCEVKSIMDSQDCMEGAVIHLKEIKAAGSTEKKERFKAIYTFNDIYGKSIAMVRAKQVAQKIAGTGGSILLIGESGTGKELFAHAIHNACRPQSPFVAINCASIPKSLIESELFGYEGGSFTGAARKGKVGKLEMANGGTLFLDEIGDMPLEVQAVLLRVLEDKRVMRIGGETYIKVDFRVIAATNKNLYQAVQQKEFREDLYFRLATFKLSIPPLRSRGKDILELARLFIHKQSSDLNRPVPEMEAAVCKRLMQYDWPGNIRQLKNAMCFAVNMREKGTIRLRDLPEELLDIAEKNQQKTIRSLTELEKEAIEEALAYTGNSLGETAIILGLGRTTLYRKIKAYGIHVEH
ncbi:sigma-54 interaction domain-containing protein [Sporomusa acidovorans]|uniref:Anaerobic nitric oxide reductase transcription regulator NorR n=1 Tax=Sporomusa acidovorans (strain ATCC 49682 / DSM 3132 / Mol) TaxID=1123286 RepID=A0ABZ3J4F9_SPOA4|nr:sigma 54-interacting transcriptional regulator [Sporomusa acidovorans]OZC16385.1 nitrogen regulation protein NR(I) [Sporomusa acidovorans DSM 3132]SDF00320.1 Transcriptional regulator containing PAS, AAA-type ATPase, and DNA-binding Fis domains [Sporomusa acidovorans]